MNRELSDLLMLHYSKRTQSLPRLAQMPSITFNGVSIVVNLLTYRVKLSIKSSFVTLLFAF